MTNNTPTPAQALGEVLKLWRTYIDKGDAITEDDAHTFNYACAQFIDDHGQHFAGLAEENDRLHAEFDFLTAQHEQCTAYMVNHRGRLVYANSGMRDAYSDEHVRAEAAEARCAELQAKYEEAVVKYSGAADRCHLLLDAKEHWRERCAEAEGLLLYIADTAPRESLGDAANMLAAFLAARGDSHG